LIGYLNENLYFSFLYVFQLAVGSGVAVGINVAVGETWVTGEGKGAFV